MSKLLPILAVETSGDLCSVAIKKDTDNYVESRIQQKHIHSEKLLSLIENVQNIAQLGIEELGSIAVSIGPGSFTGLRIGLSAVKGLAFGAGLNIVPVPTFESLAYQIAKYIPEKTAFVIANKVNVEELYFAKFIREKDNYKIIHELELVGRNDANKLIKPNELIFGNGIESEQNQNVSFPDAISIADWAYFFGEDLLTSEYDYLEPNYLKEFIVKRKK